MKDFIKDEDEKVGFGDWAFIILLIVSLMFFGSALDRLWLSDKPFIDNTDYYEYADTLTILKTMFVDAKCDDVVYAFADTLFGGDSVFISGWHADTMTVDSAWVILGASIDTAGWIRLEFE